MGRPPESTTRPATVRSRGGPSVGIVTSVVLPGSTERPVGRLGRSFVPSVGIMLIASLPAAMAGISKRPSASVIVSDTPVISGYLFIRRPCHGEDIQSARLTPIINVNAADHPPGRLERDRVDAALSNAKHTNWRPNPTAHDR